MRKKLITLVALFAIVPAFSQVKEDDVQYNQYGQKVTSTVLSTELQDGILVMQSKEAHYKMWFDIRVQGDAAVYFGQDENLVKIGNGMNIRRSRFAVKAMLDEHWYGEFDTDFTSGKAELKDAILAYKGKNFEIKAGNFKENFSLQRNTSSRYLQFMERPMVTSLAPSRHLGVAVTYSLPFIWMSGGVFGPELKGSEEMTYMEDGNKDIGLNEGLSYTAKVVARPLYKMQNASLHIGGAFSYREPKLTSTDGYNVARYSARNSTSINRKKFLDTDAIKGVDHEIAYTFELSGHYKQLRYEAAYIARSAILDPAKTIIKDKNDIKPQTADGWYVQAGWLLFGGHQNYDEGGAKYTRVTPGKSWGDVELCARYETADYNCSKYYAGGSAQAFALGLNFYPMKNVKFAINWQYNMNDKFANGKGSTDGVDKGKWNTGYDEAGNPSKIPSQIKGNGGINYHMIACRFQVAF